MTTEFSALLLVDAHSLLSTEVGNLLEEAWNRIDHMVVFTHHKQTVVGRPFVDDGKDHHFPYFPLYRLPRSP